MRMRFLNRFWYRIRNEWIAGHNTSICWLKVTTSIWQGTCVWNLKTLQLILSAHLEFFFSTDKFWNEPSHRKFRWKKCERYSKSIWNSSNSTAPKNSLQRSKCWPPTTSKARWIHKWEMLLEDSSNINNKSIWFAYITFNMWIFELFEMNINVWTLQWNCFHEIYVRNQLSFSWPVVQICHYSVRNALNDAVVRIWNATQFSKFLT